MPLKFLKKCRQSYAVTSKSLCIIAVHHLMDTSTTVDCTISSESKGQECLDNVCQRLLIQQPEFFGLRYVVKGRGEDELKWVDLERSLSRQLEKYATGLKLFLRVRHYVTMGVRHLSDESTRYYYFLQLKSDIYEGKITCDIRTAIQLALYARQTEYDSYQNDKQTKDYTKRSLVLPKNLQGLVNDEHLLEGLIGEVLQQNAGIQQLSQSQAEEMYIQCCQQLDGYGEERFQAKDTLGNDLLLGLAIDRMVVIAENGRQVFPWKDFHTVTIDKRTIKIEQNKADGSIIGSFIFTEADTARYFWKLCIIQHKFFKRYIDEGSMGGSLGDGESANGISIGGLEAVNSSVYGYDFGDSREDLLLEQQQRAIYTTSTSSSGPAAVLAANTEYLQAVQAMQQQQQHLHHGLMTSPNSSAALMTSSNVSLTPSHQSGSGVGVGGVGSGSGSGNGMPHTHVSGALSHGWLNKEFSHDYTSSAHLSGSILDTRLHSSSCLDLSNNNLNSSTGVLSAYSASANNNNHMFLTSETQERERLKAMLPTYRPAPDYETAVQLKYRTPSSELASGGLGGQYQYQTAPGLPAGAFYAGSQPDVHNTAIYSEGLNHLSLAAAASQRYPDVAQSAAAMHGHHHAAVAMSVPAHVTVGSGPVDHQTYRMHMIRTKPPPPYPVNRLSSSSTPDLAVTSHRPLLGHRTYVSGSSPDLVSNRNYLNSQAAQAAAVQAAAANAGVNPSSSTPAAMHSYPFAAHLGHSQQFLPPHGTFDNLNMIEEQPSIMSQLRQSALSQAAAAQAAAATSQSYEQTAQQQLQQQQEISGSIEPIYENVPLPVQRNAGPRSSGSSSVQEVGRPEPEPSTMRNRTPSIQSAPEGHPVACQFQQPPVPAVRHHLLHSKSQTRKSNEGNVPDRAMSTELQFFEPKPAQRVMRAASAAPAIGLSPPQQQQQQQKTPSFRHHETAAPSPSSVDGISSGGSHCISHGNNSSTSRHAYSQDDSLHWKFGAMNVSSVSSSLMYNNNNNNTTNSALDSSANSTTTAATKDPKRKRRWNMNILGRSKTPDKQKSATLGREKVNMSSVSGGSGASGQSQDDLSLTLASTGQHQRWSAGVPKLQPISGQYCKDKLCQILNEKLNDSQLFMEFEAIPKRREMARYHFALLEENRIKNSDPNFLPYDENRVRLTPTRENRHGYVNASHISATVGNKQRFYIVAQSPQDDLTTRIFWQCIWEADVYLIVQLSDELNYIPPSSSQRMDIGQFQVYQEFSQSTDRCITSKLRLYHIQSRRYRSVWHLNYTMWGEQNCPRDVNHFLDFLEELNSVRMASVNEVPPGHNTNPPVLIHCLEGGGRSGVTLTADLLLYTLDHNEDLDIPRVIDQLRHQRDSIIPSLAQYKFIYGLLITYLKRTRLI